MAASETGKGAATGLTENQKINVLDGLVDRSMFTLNLAQIRILVGKYPRGTSIKAILADLVTGRIVIPKPTNQ